MVNSPLPAGTLIRVLTTIEDGVTTHEAITDDQLVCSLKGFIEMAHQSGRFVAREVVESDLKEILGSIERAERVLDGWLRKLPENDVSDECMALCEVQQEVQDIYYHLKKIFPEK